MAGITSDANTLIDYARRVYQQYTLSYGEPMPCEQLVKAVCNMKQSYTQHGGMRPFGCSFLYAGWDRVYGFQLYQSDPSGNYGGWKATCIGGKLSTAQSIFKSDYNEECSLEEAKALAVKVLGKTIEATTLNHERGTYNPVNSVQFLIIFCLVEVSLLTRSGNSTKINILNFDQVDSFVKSYAPEKK